MIVTPVELNLDLAPTSTERSPGLHMSDIYSDLYQDLEPDRFVRGSLPAPALLAVGLALEQYTEKLLLAAGYDAYRPDEFRTPDDYSIAFSPDLLIGNGTMRGGEIKATFMSARDWPTEESSALPPKADKYVTQMKAYGHNLDINEWYLLVWFLKGQWEKGASENVLSQFRAYLLRYTAREMREEYQMLINHAKDKGML